MDKVPEQLAQLVSDFRLLEVPGNLARIAKSVLNNELPLETLDLLGLDSRGNVSTRLFAQILVECANYLRTGSASEAELQTFQYLVAPTGTIEKSCQMVAMVGLTLGAAHRSPEERVKELSSILNNPSVIPYLRARLGRQCCRNWVARRSGQVPGSGQEVECFPIHLFFKIIGKVVDSEHKHHFPMRRDFWMNYFDEEAQAKKKKHVMRFKLKGRRDASMLTLTMRT